MLASLKSKKNITWFSTHKVRVEASAEISSLDHLAIREQTNPLGPSDHPDDTWMEDHQSRVVLRFLGKAWGKTAKKKSETSWGSDFSITSLMLWKFPSWTSKSSKLTPLLVTPLYESGILQIMKLTIGHVSLPSMECAPNVIRICSKKHQQFIRPPPSCTFSKLKVTWPNFTLKPKLFLNGSLVWTPIQQGTMPVMGDSMKERKRLPN